MLQAAQQHNNTVQGHWLYIKHFVLWITGTTSALIAESHHLIGGIALLAQAIYTSFAALNQWKKYKSKDQTRKK
jgi:hypothetical protein